MSVEFVEIEAELLNGEYRNIRRRCRKGRLVHRLRQPSHRSRSKGRRVSSDRRFRRVVRARYASIQRDDHLAESSRHVGKAYRHGEPPSRPTWRRLTFQISPHRSHRQ
jgi:hypothetical protein